ncbi:MAG: hypothetical protein J6A73_05930 [Lachnospiraceae bacterium]|nr:hypothetical protein [Lachnospiraceae bacterium]
MSKIMYGENDNYHYRSSSEMSLTEQLNSAKEALDAAIRLSQTNKSDYLDNKIIEIKERILQLEQEKK